MPSPMILEISTVVAGILGMKAGFPETGLVKESEPLPVENPESLPLENSEPVKEKPNEPENGKRYYISPMCAPDNVLDVCATCCESGTMIQSYPNREGSNQRFIAEKHGEYFVLRDEHSGKVIDVDFGIAENGRKIQIWEYNTSNVPAQLWKLIPTEDGCFVICSKIDEKFCIDIPYESKDITKVQLWEFHNSPAQKFRFILA